MPLTKQQARDAARAKRPPGPTAKTQSTRAITRAVAEDRFIYPEQPGVDYNRPKTRAECAGGARPCPFVSCRYHLFLDVNRTGSIKFNFPGIEPHELAVSCALDVADAGNLTFEGVGALTNLTRERVRQLELMTLEKIAARPGVENWRDFIDAPVKSSPYRLPIWQPPDVDEETIEEDGADDDI